VAIVAASGLTTADRWVFTVLLTMADFGTAHLPERFQPRSIAELAKKCNVSARQVNYSVGHLQRHGWLERHRNIRPATCSSTARTATVKHALTAQLRARNYALSAHQTVQKVPTFQQVRSRILLAGPWQGVRGRETTKVVQSTGNAGLPAPSVLKQTGTEMREDRIMSETDAAPPTDAALAAKALMAAIDNPTFLGVIETRAVLAGWVGSRDAGLWDTRTSDAVAIAAVNGVLDLLRQWAREVPADDAPGTAELEGSAT
jgi:hypothetical protein